MILTGRVNCDINQPRFFIVLHLINSPSISFETYLGLSLGSHTKPLGQTEF